MCRKILILALQFFPSIAPYNERSSYKKGKQNLRELPYTERKLCHTLLHMRVVTKKLPPYLPKLS